MMDLPGLGIKDPVVVPSKGIKSSAFLRVIPESKIYDIMKEVHFQRVTTFWLQEMHKLYIS